MFSRISSVAFRLDHSHKRELFPSLAWSAEIGELIRQHNDANVIALPGRFIDNKTAEKILDVFFKTSFEGGRHQRRVEKIPVK